MQGPEMIEVIRQQGLVRLTLRRAEKKNALTLAMWRELHQCFLQLTAEHQAGGEAAPLALLLAGEAGAFCAGADIKELTVLLRDPAAMAANNALVAAAQLALERLPLPTLAMIDGPCFGGGFGLAAACDFRIGSTRSSFAITPAKLGLLYSIEDSRRLVGLLGAAKTRRLLMRGEQLDAATAASWGVLDALVEPDQLEATASAWLADLLQQSPTSMTGIKATLGLLSGNGAASETQVRAAFEQAFSGADFFEGAEAFLQRRKANFQSRSSVQKPQI
jgi:enoyl-CoA hydratase/carnithine racemase